MDTRPLSPADFDLVVDIDRRIHHRSRGDFFRRRLAAALRAPARHVQVAAERDGRLVGFVLARVVAGDFGRPEPTLLLEGISVDPAFAGQGVGHGLLAALATRMATRGLREISTEASWKEHAILRFLDASGFALAPRQVLRRGTEPRRPEESREGDEDLSADPHDIATMQAEDLDAVCAVDRRVTGLSRAEHIRARLEDLHAESALQASLVARVDGHVVGYLMARVDPGDFGRMGQTAVLHTIAVDPRYARRGIGDGLLEQLLKNLGALGIDRVETQVDGTAFGLLGWFHRCGFGPSDRLVFHRRT